MGSLVVAPPAQIPLPAQANRCALVIGTSPRPPVALPGGSTGRRGDQTNPGHAGMDPTVLADVRSGETTQLWCVQCLHVQAGRRVVLFLTSAVSPAHAVSTAKISVMRGRLRWRRR